MKIVISLFLFVMNIGAVDKWPVLKGPYLGQKPPGLTPEIFAPGIVSKSESRDLMRGFFEDGKLFIMYRYSNNFRGDWTIEPLILMRQVNGIWTSPHESNKVGKPWFYNLETVSTGKRMIFAWTKNLDGSGPARELYLWSSTKIPDGWTQPVRFKYPVNTGFETWPSLSDDHTLYFFSRRDGGQGGADIYMSILEKGEYRSVKNLGKIINTKYTEEDPCVAPDGSYLLFDSDRPGGYGSYDLYITWRQTDGSWTRPINLGSRINSKYSECRSYVSPDGKHLFFTSSRMGSLDAFWVDATIIQELKPK